MNKVTNWIRRQAGFGPISEPAQRIREIVLHARDTRRGTFSQHGEDVFLKDFFGNEKGSFIDIGANHPFIINNTYLLYKHGWRGVSVEPNHRLHRRLVAWRPLDVNLNVGVGREDGEQIFFQLWPAALSTFSEATYQEAISEGCRLVRKSKVKLLSLDSISEQLPSGRSPDLLSIDTEGFELEVLSGADWEQFRPRAILIENAGHGETSGEIVREFLRARDYRLERSFGCNDFFLDKGC